MDRIKKIKIKQQDGTLSDYYPIGADAQNIDFTNGYNLDQIVGDINPDEDGTLEVQLSKVIKYYNTVADMKSDTKLQEGDLVETMGYYNKNDGGIAQYEILNNAIANNINIHMLANGLFAKLIITEPLNILSLGVKNDKTADCSSIINYCLNNISTNIYGPAGTYRLDNPIDIPAYTHLQIDGELDYTGDDTAVKIQYQNSVLTFQNIWSHSGNGTCITFLNDNEKTLCVNNIVNIIEYATSANNDCIFMHSVNRGICYNTINFKKIAANANTGYGIHMKAELEGTYPRYVAENTIRGGTISRGLWGIYIESGLLSPDYSETTNNKFENCGLEGVQNGIYLNNVQSTNIDHPRYAEIDSNKTIIKYVNTCRDNHFYADWTVRMDKIDISELTGSRGRFNYIHTNITDVNGLSVGKYAYFWNSILYYEPTSYSFKNLGNTDLDLTQWNKTNYPPTYFMMKNATLKLADIYDKYGIKRIILRVASGGNPIVKDSDDNIIFNKNNTTNDGWHVFLDCNCWDGYANHWSASITTRADAET